MTIQKVEYKIVGNDDAVMSLLVDLVYNGFSITAECVDSSWHIGAWRELSDDPEEEPPHTSH